VYAYRENLYEEGYYDALAAAGAALSPNGDTDYDTFIYYCAAVMEFDKALGEIYDYLEENDLLDSTIIALFGDHNTFYQGLSKYVKNTSDTSLYTVPFMIRCPGVEHRVISKFTCTADIVPTVCDLLGINLYGNLYFGHSAFLTEESVLYSRAYGVFMTDHILFYNLNKIIWADANCDEAYMKSLIDRAYALTDKITACNRIFYGNYFAKEGKAEMYKDKMRNIN
ncbi:MAG: sulfatase-like hydrolase/transferase, partial [Eubacteriales bacterium]|nr:sulfatase-like hydrolase/transferase [Eubacteriales bacterium]